MTNKLPRALLSDIALSISLGDYAAAAALLGRDEDFLSSAVVAQYRGLTAAGLGNLPVAEAKLREALALLALRADGTASPDDAELMKKYRALGLPMLVAYTKIDIMPAEKIPNDMKILCEAGVDADLYPVSARKGKNLRRLEDALCALLPEGEKVFEQEIVSDRSEKFMIAEIMREKILLKYDKEIPHGVAIVVNTFRRRDDGEYEVNLDIVCEKKNHKAILIGKQGQALKETASFARQDMEKFLGAKVFLTTYVKVREDWRDREGLMREFGYRDEE